MNHILLNQIYRNDELDSLEADHRPVAPGVVRPLQGGTDRRCDE